MSDGDCEHKHVTPDVPGAWSCAECGLRFAPVLVALKRARAEALLWVRRELLEDQSTYRTWSYVQLSDELHRLRALIDPER